jgi:hypothetical protein
VLAHAGAPGRARTGIGIAGAGEDDDLVLGIAPHVAEGLGKLAVRQETPLQGTAAGVEGHLEDAIAPFHADGLVLRGVVVEARHLICSSFPRRGRDHSADVRASSVLAT